MIGARFAGEGDPYKVSLLRRLAMKLLAGTLSRMARTRLTDVTSGFRVANRRAIGVFAAHYPAEYLGDTVESMVIAIRAGCTVTQVPVQMRVRQGGQASQTPIRAALYLCRAVVALAPRPRTSLARRALRTRGAAMNSTVTLGIIGSAVVLLALFELLRRQRLREKYAVLWFFVALGVLAIASSRAC